MTEEPGREPAPANTAPAKAAPAKAAPAKAAPAKKAAAAQQDVLVSAYNALKKLGAEEPAARVREVASQPPPSRTVVVVGEIKRGKSSLVNSLLGVPGLARVDTDIATATAVHYVAPAETLQAGEAALRLPGGRRHRVPAGEVLDWVTVGGAHAGELIDDLVPVGAEVAVASKFLPDSTIVDTPGVNGFDPRHVAAAVEATEGACALLMVCDSSAPISASELGFLRGVTGEIGTVIFAVTKTDKALGGWQRVVDENRRLLAQYAPQFAASKVFGVSNMFATRAMAEADPDRAAKLWGASGIPALAEEIAAALGDPRLVVRRNAVQCAIVALEAVRSEVEMERRAVVDAPRLTRDVTAERERLEGLLEDRNEWSTRLSQRLNRAQLEADRKLKVELDEFKKRWEASIEEFNVVRLAKESQAIAAQMTTEIDVIAQRTATDVMENLAAEAHQMLGAASLTPELSESLGGLSQIDLRPAREYSRWKGFFDPQMVTMGVAGGSMGGSLLAATGIAAGAAAATVGLALVPVWALITVGFRAKRFGKQNFGRWIAELVRQAHEDILSALKTTYNEFGPELRLAYRAMLEESIKRAQQLVKDAEKQSSLSDNERAQRGEQLQRRVDAIDALVGRLAADKSAVRSGSAS